MAINLPQKPRSGFHSINELTRAINGVIDFLASFVFAGDGIIKVNRTMFRVDFSLDLDKLKYEVPEPENDKSIHYTGMFKLQREPETNYVEVINGSNTDDSSCGIVSSEGTIFHVNKKGAYVNTGETLHFYVVKIQAGYEILISDTFLGYSADMPAVLIGTAYSNGEELKIVQEHTGAIHLDGGYSGMFSAEIYMDSGRFNYFIRGGQAYANATGFTVNNTSTQEVQNGTTYVYFSVEYDTSDKTFQNAEIKAYRNIQNSTQYKKFLLVSTIVKSNNGVSVHQNQMGEIQVFFWGECEHDDEE